MLLPVTIVARIRIPLARLLPLACRYGWDALRVGTARLGGGSSREQQALNWVLQQSAAGNPEAVLHALDRFGKEKYFLMNIGDKKGLLLDQAVRDSKARRALELGAYCGYSAVRIARLLPPEGRLISLEKSPEYARVARQVVAHAGLADRVEIQLGEAAQLLPALSGPFDLVLLDHWKDCYLPDLKRIEKHGLLRPGSIVVADNVGIFDASSYLAHVRNASRYDSVHHEATLEYDDSVPDAVEVSTWRG